MAIELTQEEAARLSQFSYLVGSGNTPWITGAIKANLKYAISMADWGLNCLFISNTPPGIMIIRKWAGGYYGSMGKGKIWIEIQSGGTKICSFRNALKKRVAVLLKKGRKVGRCVDGWH